MVGVGAVTNRSQAETLLDCWLKESVWQACTWLLLPLVSFPAPDMLNLVCSPPCVFVFFFV